MHASAWLSMLAMTFCFVIHMELIVGEVMNDETRPV